MYDGATGTNRRRVYGQLRELVLTTELKPGAELSEQELMARLAVGRTPLRDALLQLASQGLVEITPRRGTRVAEVSVRDLPLIFEARLGVERLVAGAATRRADESQIQRMRDLVDKLATTVTTEAQFELDQQFHHLMLEAAGNRYITDLYERLSADATRLLYLSGCGMEQLSEQIAFVEQVATALLEKDAAATERLLVRHVEEFRERLTDALVRN